MKTLKIIWLIWKERKHQNKIWGTNHDRKHTLQQWYEIIYCYNEKMLDGCKNCPDDCDRRRLVQIAAICIAALQTGNY